MKKDERALIDAAMIWHAVNVIKGTPLRAVDQKLSSACVKLLRGSGWTMRPKRPKAKRGAK